MIKNFKIPTKKQIIHSNVFEYFDGVLLSTIIEALEELKEKYGDKRVDYQYYGYDGGYDANLIEDVVDTKSNPTKNQLSK